MNFAEKGELKVPQSHIIMSPSAFYPHFCLSDRPDPSALTGLRWSVMNENEPS